LGGQFAIFAFRDKRTSKETLMDIVKQVIDQRVGKLVAENQSFFTSWTSHPEQQKSLAFLALGVAAYLDIDIVEAIEYLTDGGNDGGFDAAYMADKNESELRIVLFQAKYTRDLAKDSNFPENAVEKSVNTVQNIFDPSRSLSLNPKSKAVVDEVRSMIADGVIPYVQFVLVNNGIKWNQNAQNHIDNAFKGNPQVEFIHLSHNEIVKYVTSGKKVDETISLSGLAIKEDFNYKEVILGRVAVSEIGRIMEAHGDTLLESNIRKYLGDNAINKAIESTLIDKEKQPNFFFYNNGITMVCDTFGYNALQKSDWKVQAKDLRIINGGQTCKTIHKTISENPDEDFSQATVLLRLYAVTESDNEVVIAGITEATNSQNPVDVRDLKSNDKIQILLEQGAKDLGYTYKRKRDAAVNLNADVIPLSVAAEAVLSVWRKKPHLARFKKNEFFNHYYHEIFGTLNAAQMVIAVLIFRLCNNNRKKTAEDPEIQVQRNYSHYVLAAIIGKNILDKHSMNMEQLVPQNFEQIKMDFEQNKDALYQQAEAQLLDALRAYFSNQRLDLVDGRRLAAVFRRFDFVETCLGCP
jgi:hypothetical protein